MNRRVALLFVALSVAALALLNHGDTSVARNEKEMPAVVDSRLTRTSPDASFQPLGKVADPQSTLASDSEFESSLDCYQLSILTNQTMDQRRRNGQDAAEPAMLETGCPLGVEALPHLAAARAIENGSRLAALCLLSGDLGDIPTVGIEQEQHAEIRRAALEAGRIGIEGGDWSIVRSFGLALGQQHSVLSRYGVSAADRYLYSRLAYLGADSDSLKKIFWDQSLLAGTWISADSINALNNKANNLFNRNFQGRVMSEKNKAPCSAGR